MQFQPGVGQPLGKLRAGAIVVVVEMRPGREQFDRVEAVRGDVDEVIAGQPVLVEEVRRNAEARLRGGGASRSRSYCRSSSRCAASSS
jgi:hypothetical protein